MNIEVFGGGERCRAASRVLSAVDFSDAPYIEDIKILPIPSTKDGERITGTEIQISDLLDKLSYGSFVIGYGIPKEIKSRIEEVCVGYYDGAEDEEFLVENAYITAVGTLSYLLSSSKKIVRDSSFGVVGYGRIGSALSRLLLFLGAKLRIFSSKPLTRIELGAFGIESSEIKLGGFDFSDLSGIDFLINTAPCNLSRAFPDKRVPEGMRVLDLASGDSFPGVVGVEYLPSLPGRLYPESAGEAYAKFAARAILADVNADGI